MLHLIAENGDLAPVLLQRVNTNVFRVIQPELYVMENYGQNGQSKECLLNDVVVIFWLIPRPYIEDY